jgi:hypothetical protein
MNSTRPIPHTDEFNAPFWEALRRREFVLPRSTATGEFFSPLQAVPAGGFEWAAARPKGRIVSYSWVHLQPAEGYADQLPYVLATVELDDGPQLMANIVDAEADQVRIGQRVRLTFEERADGWVIPQFTPTKATRKKPGKKEKPGKATTPAKSSKAKKK